ESIPIPHRISNSASQNGREHLFFATQSSPVFPGAPDGRGQSDHLLRRLQTHERDCAGAHVNVGVAGGDTARRRGGSDLPGMRTIGRRESALPTAAIAPTAAAPTARTRYRKAAREGTTPARAAPCAATAKR